MCLESPGQILNGPLVCYFYLCSSLRNKLQTGTCINTNLSSYSIKSTSCDGSLEKTLSHGVVTWCGSFLVDWVDWRNPVAAVYKPWFHSHKWSPNTCTHVFHHDWNTASFSFVYRYFMYVTRSMEPWTLGPKYRPTDSYKIHFHFKKIWQLTNK